MDLFANRLGLMILIFIVVLTGLGSAVRIVTEPQPLNNMTENLNISCITDDPVDRTKSVISIEIMKRNSDTEIAAINKKQGLKRGPEMKNNMKAEGHVDTTDTSKSILTLIITKPGRQDVGIYRCRVYFTDKTSNVVEESVTGIVTYKACPEGWRLYQPDSTCLRAPGAEGGDEDHGKDWFSSRRVCQAYGGDLVQIRDEDKNKFVYNMFEGIRHFQFVPWIGIKNNATDGTYHFKYVDGSDLETYHPWDSRFPKYGWRSCVGMFTSNRYKGEWFDYDCRAPLHYVCSIAAI